MVTFVRKALSFFVFSRDISSAHICGLAGLQLWALGGTVVPRRAYNCGLKFCFEYFDVFLMES